MNLIKRAWLVWRLRHRFYRWDRPTLERHRAARVRKMLDFLCTHSPFYADLPDGGCALEDVPVIDKTVMMANFDAINTAGLHRDDLVAFKIQQERAGTMDLYDGQYSIGLSSGTSGNRGLTVLSKVEREDYGCLIWARSGIPKGIGPIRLLFTLRTNNVAFMQPKSPGVQTIFADYTHSPDELIGLMNDKRINVLAGPPSMLLMIADRTHALARPLKTIISYAEVLDDGTAACLTRKFQAPVIQIYQCSEGFIASTCRHGNLHLNEDVMLVQGEPVGGPGSDVQNVVLTDLYRTTQPIFRYRLGDLLEFDPEPCPCGSCFRRVRVIHGRSDDIFHLTGGQGETRYLFPDYVRRAINQASGEIVEYQALQHSPEEIEIRLTTVPGADRGAIESQIMDNLQWRASAVGGRLGRVRFTETEPERNPNSGKLIRVARRF